MHLLDSNILIYAGQSGNEFLDAWLTAEGARISAISIPEEATLSTAVDATTYFSDDASRSTNGVGQSDP